jgi:protein-S-isoprenylcysteine O-methyltransferase Ste14
MSALSLRIPPLAVVAAFAAAIVLAGIHVPLARISVPGHAYLAVSLAVLGFLIALLGVIQFRRAGTTVNPMAPHKASAVVSSGIYRVSRNPMYLGFALALLGVAAWTCALTGYCLVLGFCWYLTRFQIIPEEQALLAAFGDEFTRYKASVRRWL